MWGLGFDILGLSDEENWYFVLDNWYLSESEEDCQAFETMSTDIQEVLKQQSWERVFKVDPFEDQWTRRGMFVQATFWELKQEEIRKVIQYGKR